MTAMISGSGVPFAANATVNKVPGATLIGIVAAASTSGTIAIYDSNATSTAVPLLAATPLVAGQFLPLYLACSQGHYIVVGGTLSATAIVG
ncbi:hypothetical protein [Caballeronia sp. ATUFL_M1_KS5A]|uniref:hypothetical protein n=1 Tax=Caballeronia sp. ATUFL_M1_KS5A TaxID=2921778 RepID=UPI0020288FA2|nr:hypothetical protein [Caballeronia sp. ATUFL_M1_KS5A]